MSRVGGQMCVCASVCVYECVPTGCVHVCGVVFANECVCAPRTRAYSSNNHNEYHSVWVVVTMVVSIMV